MRIERCLAIGMFALGALSAAWAQFTGPAPLAWRWAHSTPVSPLGSPLVVDDTVYVAVGNRMFGLDRATGNQKWRFPLVEGIPGYFRSGPVMAEGTVIAAADNRYVYGVDAETGNSKWQWVSQVPIVGQPVLAGNIVVLQLNDNTIMGIRADNGQPEWKTPDGMPAPYKVFAGITGGLAVHGTSILFITNDGDLTAISATSRKQIWKARFSQVSPDSTPVLFGDTIYVNSGNYVVAVNAISGGPRWQQNMGEVLDYSPAASAEGVFVVTTDGKAYILDALSGRPKSRQPLDLGSVLAVRPSAIDKMFLAPLTSGALTLVDPASQQVSWSYLVRPLFKTMGNTSATNPGTGGGQRRGGGALGGGGARGGGGLAGGGGGNQGTAAPIAVPASGPAVLAGQTLFVLIADGSLLAFDKSFGVDLTGPSIQMVWPNPGDQVCGQPPLELIWKIDDESSGVNDKTVTVEIDGRTYEAEYGRDGFAIVKVVAFGKNVPLTDGRKLIRVTAVDWLGNRKTEEFSLTVDNTLPPLVRTSSTTNSNPGRGGGLGGGRGGGGGRDGG